ncbi:MAG: hypothetical protein HRT37_25920 [Alteromonadaceae bacterium]|nr:hypothetical protein [Alteromonadaceae bacterium]
MTHIGQIKPEGSTDYADYYYRQRSNWDDRTIFHGDDLYYIHANQIWRSIWSDPESVTGPF